jgi:MAC/Perforin domain
MKQNPRHRVRLVLLLICAVSLQCLEMMAQNDDHATSGANKEAKEQKKQEPVPVPSLPAGATLDLSAPELKTPDGIPFKLPQELSISSPLGAVDQVSALSNTDWMIIAKNTNMLRGSRMEKIDPQHPDESLGKVPLLVWKVPADDSFVTPSQDSSVDAEVSYSEATADFVSCGYDEESASGSYYYCSGSFARKHEEKRAESTAQKKVYMTGFWRYPEAIVDLSQCTTVSPLFEKSVEDALDGKGFPQNPHSSHDPGRDLMAVFDYFGHAVPSRVVIGAQLTFRSSEETSAKSSMKEVKDTISGAVSVKVGAFGGSSGASFQNASRKTVTAKKLAESFHFRATGGDLRLASDPNKWASTTKIWKLWAVIRKMDLRPTYELLNPELKQRVLDLWPKMYPILDPADLPWRENEGSTEHAENSGFVIATQYARNNNRRGSVIVASGGSQELREDAPDTATGAAFMHFSTDNNNPYRGSSVGMPVRQGGLLSGRLHCKFPLPRRPPIICGELPKIGRLDGRT